MPIRLPIRLAHAFGKARHSLRPNLLLNTNVGHHIEIFDRTNELELDPESIVAHGFTVALGFEWWP